MWLEEKEGEASSREDRSDVEHETRGREGASEGGGGS